MTGGRLAPPPRPVVRHPFASPAPRRLRWLLALAVSAATIDGLAQVIPPGQPLPPVFDPTLRSGQPPPFQKERPLEPLPPLPVPPPPALKEKPVPGALSIFVREIRIAGNTVFSDRELAEVTAPYLNRRLTSEDLESVRVALTLYYVNRGYITSGAVIPDQDPADGVLRIDVIEGRLTQIEVEGTRWFRPAYFRDRLLKSAGPPVNLFALQERLQLFQQDARIERINAELRHGASRGESDLHLRVAEASPFKAWLDFNNYQTPVVGAERGLATVAHQNLTGHADALAFTYGRSSGVNPIIDASYLLPVTAADTTLSVSYRRNDFLVIESPFRPLDINSDAEIFGISLRQPVYRSLTQVLVLSLTGEYLYNKTTLQGQPFEFVAGMRNGVGTVAVIRFGQEWIRRTPTSVIAVRSRFSLGVDALDATTNSGPVADTQYFAWLAQAQYVQRVEEWGGFQLLGRMDMQIANDRLFPLEQMAVGGRFSVRGYRENQLVRDNAFLASLEGRYPLVRRANGEDWLQLASFIDVGRAWNAKGPTPDPETLASVGLGVRWGILPAERAYFELYWGIPLNHVETPGGNLQDHGIHLQLVVQVL